MKTISGSIKGRLLFSLKFINVTQLETGFSARFDRFSRAIGAILTVRDYAAIGRTLMEDNHRRIWKFSCDEETIESFAG